jgi:hypothetical protein
MRELMAISMRCLAAAFLGAVFVGQVVAQEPAWSEWSYAAPFDHPGGLSAHELAHAPEEELENMVVDGEGPELEALMAGGQGGVSLRWGRFKRSPAPDGWFETGVISFLHELDVPAVNNACAYLYRSVKCSEDVDLLTTMGSDDSLRIWLNGELVHDFRGGRGVDLRQDEVVLPLKAGVNHLLVKVVQGGGAWGFGARTPEYLHTGDRALAQEDINRAINEGVDWLIGAQFRDGSWPFEQHRYRNGQTGLALYALLKSGVSPTHPAIMRGFAFLSGKLPEMTYSAGCELLALASLPGNERLERMEEIVELLYDWERRGFGYPDGEEDLSNTQYAALGFFAAQSKGIEIPSRSWNQLISYTLVLRDGEGGFGYRPAWEANGSMTSAGLTCLSIALNQLGEGGGKRREARKAIDEGVEWFAKNFSRETNPGGGQRWHSYYLYGIERVCAIEKLDLIGAHHWYWEGASWFVTKQGRDGSWGSGGDRYFETSFALLFLSRATKSLTGGKTHTLDDLWWTQEPDAEVMLRATGDTPMAIWLDGFGREFLEEKQGIRVDKVEYLFDGELAHTVPGSTDQKWAGEKFAIRHRFPKSAAYEVIARVHYVPGAIAQPAGVNAQTVDSPPLKVSVDEIPDDWMLSSAEGSRFNLMPTEGVKVSATSVNVAGQEAQKAIDGHEVTAWFCGASDQAPSLTIELKRAVRINRVVIAQAPPDPLDVGKADYAQRVSLRMDKDKDRYEATAPVDRRAPTVVDLGKDVRARRIEIQLLDRIPGSAWPGRAGINEVLLQFVEKDGTLKERRIR